MSRCGLAGGSVTLEVGFEVSKHMLGPAFSLLLQIRDSTIHDEKWNKPLKL